jgi:hypothetical protein
VRGGVSTSSSGDDVGILRWSFGSGEPSYGGSGSRGSSSGDHLGAISFRWARRQWQQGKGGGSVFCVDKMTTGEGVYIRENTQRDTEGLQTDSISN